MYEWDRDKSGNAQISHKNYGINMEGGINDGHNNRVFCTNYIHLTLYSIEGGHILLYSMHGSLVAKC